MFTHNPNVLQQKKKGVFVYRSGIVGKIVKIQIINNRKRRKIDELTKGVVY